MADNVAITAGSGTTIATDEVAVNGGSTAHVQYVKLVDGAGNGTPSLVGGAISIVVVAPGAPGTPRTESPSWPKATVGESPT